jgi:hypothetical protein
LNKFQELDCIALGEYSHFKQDVYFYEDIAKEDEMIKTWNLYLVESSISFDQEARAVRKAV